MLTLNGLFRLPSIGLRLHPYVGIGAGVALPHSEVQMVKDPGRTYEYQYAGPVGQALIGIEFRVPRMSYFFEYKFTLARLPDAADASGRRHPVHRSLASVQALAVW